MKISTTDKDTTIIEFSRAELEGCRLTYENLARDTARSRQVLLTIMSETARISGHRTFIDSNTAMDILPDGEGGCVIILRAVKRKEDNTFGIFCCNGIDGVIDLSRALKSESTGRFMLYRRGDTYYVAAKCEEVLLKICGEFLLFLSSEETDEARLDETAERLGELKEVFCRRASEK